MAGSVDVFASDLWDSMSDRIEDAVHRLIEYCRPGTPEIRWDVERFSGGKMAFEVWVSLVSRRRPDSPEVGIEITFWDRGGRLDDELRLSCGGEAFVDTGLRPLKRPSGPDDLRDSVTTAVDELLDILWAHRDEVSGCLRDE